MIEIALLVGSVGCALAGVVYWIKYLPPIEDGDDLEGDE